ncbi:hypothetical protein Mapa_017520 [Marchantia paleacea]|nr:hypothetical protein Mapa_017520 [Marchantia paleacea]
MGRSRRSREQWRGPDSGGKPLQGLVVLTSFGLAHLHSKSLASDNVPFRSPVDLNTHEPSSSVSSSLSSEVWCARGLAQGPCEVSAVGAKQVMLHQEMEEEENEALE